MKRSTLLMVLSLVLALALGVGGTMAYLQDTDSDVNVMTLGNVYIEQHEYERIPDEENGGYKTTTTASGTGYELQEFTQEKPLYPSVGDYEKMDETFVYFDQLDENAGGEAGVAGALANVQDKFVVVENTGKSDAYVRTLFAFEGTDALTEYLGLGITEDWAWNDPKLEIVVDGATYVVMEAVYVGSEERHSDGILPAGEWTPSSLSQVFLRSDATNEVVEGLDTTKDGDYNILVLSQAVQTMGFENAKTALDTAFGPVNVDNGTEVAEWFNAVLADSEAPEATEAPDALVNTKEGLLQAIKDAEDGDVIYVAAGTFDLKETPLVIDKEITIEGTSADKKPEFKMTTSDGTAGVNKIFHGIEIQADNVTLRNLAFTVDSGDNGTGNLVQISSKSKEEYYSDITIDGCEFYGSDHCIALYGNNVTIKNCILDESTADDQGNVIYVWGTSGKLVIENNQFIGADGRKHGVSFYEQAADDTKSEIAGDILIDGNTFTKMYKSIVHESNMTYNNVTMTVSNNTVTDCVKKPVAIDNGTFLSYTVTGNVINTLTEGNCVIDNKKDVAVTANGNYWGSESPNWNEVISGANVTVENYYTDSAKTNLVNK